MTDTLAPMSSQPCPDENALARFARGHGRELELPAIEAHLDGCESCRRAVAAAASTVTLPTLPPSQELTPGVRVGRYEIERELGRGGMGVVYMARDVTLDRRVALKLLHARRDEAAQARLLREAQVMAKLAHPNVVPVFELGDWRGDLYLVMELVNGLTLDAWLKGAKHTQAEILSRFVEAGRGLAAAHAAGVVHRDFKPANVLVGVDGRVRVTDFGLSRPGPAVELPPMASPLVTRDGAIVGTVAYMAPEQLDGRPADERSDQFAFCVSLVEALTGQRPFEGDNWSALAVNLAKPPRLGDIPSRLRAVLRRGLSSEPSQRYTSMSALLNALEAGARPSRTFAVAALGAVIAIGAAAGAVVLGQRGAAPAAAVAPGENLVPIVVAGRDIEEGTVLTMEMVEQRVMPEMYVTSSIVKPDSVSYIINQKIVVPVQKGDPLLWSQFETSKAEEKVAVEVAAADLTEGSVVTAAMLEERSVPSTLATSSVVKPHTLQYVLGSRLTVPVQKGDMLLWSQLAAAEPPATKKAEAGTIALAVGATKTLAVPGLQRVAIGDASIADVKTTGSGQLELMGAAEGKTTLLVWKKDGQRLSYVVSVGKAESATTGESADISLAVGTQKVLTVPGLQRLAVGDPAVADVKSLPDDQLVISGVAEGKTTLMLWKKDNQRVSYLVTVRASASESLGASQILEVVLSHKGELARCVEAQRKANPSVSGKLVLRWTIEPAGSVADVRLETPELDGSVVATCISTAVATWTFPRSEKGNDAVTFPFKF